MPLTRSPEEGRGRAGRRYGEELREGDCIPPSDGEWRLGLGERGVKVWWADVGENMVGSRGRWLSVRVSRQ